MILAFATETVSAAEPVSAMDATLLSLLSIFGGVALTIVAGLIGAWIQGRREHAKWHRDQRLVAYGDLLSATDNYLGAAARNDVTELPAVIRESLTASARIHLVGPHDVYHAAEAFQEATRASVQAFRREPEVQDEREEARLAARQAFIDLAQRKIRIKN